MGDHFVLLVDRLLTESTLEAAIESRNRSLQASALAADDKKVFDSSPKVDLSSPRKIVECRICQDEDEDSNMETPCSCCGSLEVSMLIEDVYKDGAMRRATLPVKYATRTYLIRSSAFQQFKPGYTAPPPLLQIRRFPMNLRANWEISRRELNNSRFIAVVSTDRHYDEYSVSTTRSSICYRTVAIVFMLLLILRHTLPIMVAGTNDNTFLLFMLLLLPTVGIILPIYVMVKAMTAIRHRRQQQESPNSLFARSDEEIEHSIMQTQPHIVSIP
ncbi:hypothetical protein V6N12_060053 [Hibiscus sabdariffa]|uniref:RING-CH-type domain-containing protein n=1 Tax=Hibiscus sabdariffa TaxID=183260 RepID=A0ABR2D627_9ROSI